MNALHLLRSILRDDDRGAAIAEFALSVPLLFVMLGGIVEVGRYMYVGIEVGNAARTGAYYGAQNHVTAADTSSSGGMVTAALSDATDLPSISAVATNACSCYNTPGTSFPCSTGTDVQPCNASSTDHRVIVVQVNATATYTPFLSAPGIPASLTIVRSAIAPVTP